MSSTEHHHEYPAETRDNNDLGSHSSAEDTIDPNTYEIPPQYFAHESTTDPTTGSTTTEAGGGGGGVPFRTVTFPHPAMEADYVDYAYNGSMLFAAVASAVGGVINIVLVFLQLSLKSGSEGIGLMICAVLGLIIAVIIVICWKKQVLNSPVWTERWWILANLLFMLGQAVMSHNRIQNTICKSTTFKPTRTPGLCDHLIDGNQVLGCCMFFTGAPRTRFTAPMLVIFVAATIGWRFAFWEVAVHDYDVFTVLLATLFAVALHTVETSTRTRFVYSLLLHRQTTRAVATRDAVNRMLEAIVPACIVKRIIAGEGVTDVADATVLFSDIAGFTKWSSSHRSIEVVRMLNTMYHLFDRRLEAYGVEKITTIGDAYWAVSGLPTPQDASHAHRVCGFALSMQRSMLELHRSKAQYQEVAIRIGVNTGTICGGIMGETQFAYQVFGKEVDTAQHCEENAPVGGVLISANTYRHLQQYATVDSSAAMMGIEVSPGRITDQQETFILMKIDWRPPGFNEQDEAESMMGGGSTGPAGATPSIGGSHAATTARSAQYSARSGHSSASESTNTRALLLSGLRVGGTQHSAAGASRRVASTTDKPQRLTASVMGSSGNGRNAACDSSMNTADTATTATAASNVVALANSPSSGAAEAERDDDEATCDIDTLKARMLLRKYPKYEFAICTFADDELEAKYKTFIAQACVHASQRMLAALSVLILALLIALAAELNPKQLPGAYVLLAVDFVLCLAVAVAAKALPRRIGSYVCLATLYLTGVLIYAAGGIALPSIVSTEIGYVLVSWQLLRVACGNPGHPWLGTMAVDAVMIYAPYAIVTLIVNRARLSLGFFIPQLCGALMIWSIGHSSYEKGTRVEFVEQHVAVVAEKVARSEENNARLLLSRTVPTFVLPELMAWLSRSAGRALTRGTIAHRYADVGILFAKVPELKHTVTDSSSSALASADSDASVIALALLQKMSRVVAIYEETIAAFSNVTKIKTIGDVLLAAGGLEAQLVSADAREGDGPSSKMIAPQVLAELLQLGLTIHQRVTEAFNTDDNSGGANKSSAASAAVVPLVGVHVGPVVGGVLGDDRLIYDVFGDTVNTASRIMSTASSSSITQQSPAVATVWTSTIVRDRIAGAGLAGFTFGETEHRAMKGKGQVPVCPVFSPGVSTWA